MTLYERIKQDLLNARTMRDIANVTLYSTLLGDIERNPKKDYSDAAVTSVIRKFIAGSEEIVKLRTGSEAAAIATREISVLSVYLPKQMETSQIAALMKTFKDINPGCKINDVMNYFATTSANLGLAVDKSVVARLFKQVE